MNSTAYVVTMYRFGDREMHSYVIGVYSKKAQAIRAAEEEREYRGGNKYFPEVLEVEVNVDYVANRKTDMPKEIVGLNG